MGELAQHLKTAQGFLELGMFNDASDELEKIAPEEKTNLAVIGFRVALYSAAQKWELAAVVACHMALSQPQEPVWWINWAYATRRSKSIEDAKEILLDAEKQHPSEPTIKFNLACYESQMGNLDEAKRKVTAAIKLDKSFQKLALDDPDLEPIWKAISKG